jgi:hypothetical protein
MQIVPLFTSGTPDYFRGIYPLTLTPTQQPTAPQQSPLGRKKNQGSAFLFLFNGYVIIFGRRVILSGRGGNGDEVFAGVGLPFHKRCVRSMCRVSLRHAFHHLISSATLFQRLNVMDLDSYYHDRILRWAGHVARMPMTRAPRQLLTGWVAHSRPNGCPEMTWGRTLKMALKCKGLPANFKEWRAIAEDRSEWRSRTYSKPMPPSEN